MHKKQPARSVRSILLESMRFGCYTNSDRLPSENVLASKLGISRTQLRDSLATLEQEGFISRRQGVGTIINKHVLDVTARMDLEVEFLDMICEHGYEPGTAFVKVTEEFCSRETASKLGINEGFPVIRIDRLITADGRPAIYCSDYISFRIIKDLTFSGKDLEKPIFVFLKEFCGTDVYMDLSVVKPVAADEQLSSLFGIEKGTPMLYLDETGFDIDGRIVLWSNEYYADNILQHTILRKKI